MPAPRHKAIVAGLAVTLTFGGVALPAVATTAETSATDSDPNGVGMPAPASFNKADYYEGTEGISTFASARSASTLSPVTLSDEMKYFTKFESGCNYDKVLSHGDGYNAMGYYQFDRRYSLLPFIQQVYSYNPVKYAMFEAVLAQRDVLSSPSYSMYDDTTRQLTAPAQLLNDAWHAAYAADPAEFSALQDAYAYNNYYLPVQSSLLNTYGVDVRDRADCVKGLVWGMCNLFGQGGVQKFFRGADINDQMTDRELVVALCDTVIEYVDDWYPNQPQYWSGWKNRYEKEKETCLTYLDQHDKDQNAGDQGIFSGASNGVGGGAADGSDSGQSEPGAGDAVSGFGDAGVDAGDDESGSNGVAPDDSGSAGSGEGDAAAGGVNAPGTGVGSPDAGSDGADAPGIDVNAPGTGTPGIDVNAPGTGAPGIDVNAPGTGAPTEGSSNAPSFPADDASTDQAPGGAGSGSGDVTAGDSKTEVDNKVPSSGDGTAKDTLNALGVSGSTDDSATDRAGGDASSREVNGTKGDLPQTGDIAAMVMTGAAGLTVAGGSFLSLAKKERDDR